MEGEEIEQPIFLLARRFKWAALPLVVTAKEDVVISLM
jgi:hypothetical protein